MEPLSYLVTSHNSLTLVIKVLIDWKCHQLLLHMASAYHVELRWMSGHAGLYGNGRADTSADASAFKCIRFVGPESVGWVSSSLARTTVLKRVALQSLDLCRDYAKNNRCLFMKKLGDKCTGFLAVP